MADRTPWTDLELPGHAFKNLKDVNMGFKDYWKGRLLLWEAPENGCTYTVAADIGTGVGKDLSAVEVIRHGDLHRCDAQVAEFASDFHDPVEMAYVINQIGRFFCEDDGTEALAVIEVNPIGGGEVTQQDLINIYEYGNIYLRKTYDKVNGLFTPKMGWYTNRSTRPKLIARAIHAFHEKEIIVRSPFLLDEMSDFEPDFNLALGKQKEGIPDDRVMAFLICYWAAHEMEWMAGETMAERRRLLTDARKVDDATEGPRRDWQNTDMSFDAMMASWDEE